MGAWRGLVTWWREIGTRGLTCDIAVALPNSIAASNPAMWIFDKIKEVYKASAAGFRSPLTVTFGDDHWREFKEAMEIETRSPTPSTCGTVGALNNARPGS